MEDCGREQQRYRYGSEEWLADYTRRIAVERYNAELRINRSTMRESLTRCLGLVKNTIMAALFAGAGNIRTPLDLYDHHPDLEDEPVDGSKVADGDGPSSDAASHVAPTCPATRRPVKTKHRKP